MPKTLPGPWQRFDLPAALHQRASLRRRQHAVGERHELRFQVGIGDIVGFRAQSGIAGRNTAERIDARFQVAQFTNIADQARCSNSMRYV